MRIFTSPTDLSDPNLKRQVVAWPLSADPGTAGEVAKVPKTRCLVLTGPDLETLLTVARTANTLTTWTYGADRYSVYVRPLYPDETGCPASGGPISVSPNRFRPLVMAGLRPPTAINGVAGTRLSRRLVRGAAQLTSLAPRHQRSGIWTQHSRWRFPNPDCTGAVP